VAQEVLVEVQHILHQTDPLPVQEQQVKDILAEDLLLQIEVEVEEVELVKLEKLPHTHMEVDMVDMVYVAQLLDHNIQ